MADEDDLISVVRALNWGLDADGTALAGAASGAGVYRVRADGTDAVLKVTAAGPGQPAARRELRFYRTLANQVPVATPTLLRHADDDNVTAMLLSAHMPARPARDWDLPAWLELASQLAALHSAPLPSDVSWLDTPWLPRTLDRPPIDSAEAYWSTTVAGHQVRQVLRAPAALGAAVAALPGCLLHGDCHVGNLLAEGSHLVWADWQVVGVGSPAVDLAFLWSRAYADGADPPYGAMVDAYAARRGIDRDLLRRALIAAELGVLLFGWPAYAARRTRAERDRLTRRLAHLVERWRSAAAA